MKSAQKSGRVELVAHRGASFDAPENTLAAFQLAWSARADAVELDIYQTKDDHLVVIHDDNAKRTTGVDGKIEEMTLKEVQQLDAGGWKGAEFAGEPIPTLDQVFATGSVQKRFFVEIKSEQVSLALLRASIERAGLGPDQVVVMSFLPPVVRAAKKEMPLHPVLWLVNSPGWIQRYMGCDVPIEQVIAAAEGGRLDGLGLHLDWPIDRAFVQKIQGRNLKVYVWTVDDASIARGLRQAGVDGMMTNRVAWLREQLDSDKVLPG